MIGEKKALIINISAITGFRCFMGRKFCKKQCNLNLFIDITWQIALQDGQHVADTRQGQVVESKINLLSNICAASGIFKRCFKEISIHMHIKLLSMLRNIIAPY